MTDIKADDKALENGLYRSVGDPTEILKNAKRILIIAGQPTNDVIAASIALALYIKDIFNKEAQLVCFDQRIRELISSELVSMHQIDTQLESMLLRIVVDHSGTKLDSLNYYKDLEDEDKLVLDIKPVSREFDIAKRVSFSKKGLDYDVVITVGVSNLESLGQAYTENEEMFEKATMVNYDVTRENKRFGKLNIIDTSATYLTKLVFNQFIESRFAPDMKCSKALLIGLSS